MEQYCVSSLAVYGGHCCVKYKQHQCYCYDIGDEVKGLGEVKEGLRIFQTEFLQDRYLPQKKSKKSTLGMKCPLKHTTKNQRMCACGQSLTSGTGTK